MPPFSDVREHMHVDIRARLVLLLSRRGIGAGAVTRGRLILIEGLPGCGKTTTAAKVSASLRRAGFKAGWWREEAVDHPATPRDLRRSARDPGFGERCLTSWARLAASLELAPTVYVLEGSAFQSALRFMLERDIDPEDILAYVRRFDQVVLGCVPAMVYLQTAEPSNFLRQEVFKSRGEQWVHKISSYLAGTPYCQRRRLEGSDGMVAFWLAYRRLCDEALDHLSMPVLRVDVGVDDWKLANASVPGWIARHCAESG